MPSWKAHVARSTLAFTTPNGVSRVPDLLPQGPMAGRSALRCGGGALAGVLPSPL